MKDEIVDFGDAIDPNASWNRREKPVRKYRKTALIEATQWFKAGDHPAVGIYDDITADGADTPYISTLEGGHIVTPGDWIATGAKGEHWAIKPDIFAETYELVESPATPMTDIKALDAAATLLPCPNEICDYSRPHLNETDGDLDATHTWVSCENCGACGPRIPNPSQYYGRTCEWEAVKAEAIALWNTRAKLAPADGAAVEAMHDLITHRSSWRNAIVLARDFACEGSEMPDADRSYWNHELDAFDRTFAALAAMGEGG